MFHENAFKKSNQSDKGSKQAHCEQHKESNTSRTDDLGEMLLLVIRQHDESIVISYLFNKNRDERDEKFILHMTLITKLSQLVAIRSYKKYYFLLKLYESWDLTEKENQS